MRSSEMKKFLLVAAGMGVVTILLLLMNDMLCKSMIFASTGSVQYKMYRLFNERPNNEIAIIGSSRAQGHYVPSILGDNVFNYGLDGSGMYETMLHLHALLARGGTDLIIINLDPWGLGGRGLRGDYSLATNRADVPSAERKLPALGVSAWPGVRFWGKLRSSAANWLNAKMGGTKHIDNGAILCRHSLSDAEWTHVIRGMKVADFGVNDGIQEDLECVLDARHPPICFVIAPITKPWYEKFASNNKNVSGLESLKARLSSFRNTMVIDLLTPNLGAYSLAEFKDQTHLNEHGARRFSEELKAQMSALVKEP